MNRKSFASIVTAASLASLSLVSSAVATPSTPSQPVPQGWDKVDGLTDAQLDKVLDAADALPNVGERYNVVRAKHVGIYQVVALGDKGIRFQRVSADGTRLLDGKSFTITAVDYATESKVGGDGIPHTFLLAA